MRSGTYRGTSEDLSFEIRVEQAPGPQPLVVSGDVSLGSRFLASFFAPAPVLTDRRVAGTVQFRGNARLFTGDIQLTADDRGIGVFELGVDLEGGHRDVIAGRVEWTSSSLRRLTIEVDGLRGMPFFPSFTDHQGRVVTIESTFAAAGFDAQLVVDPFLGVPTALTEQRGFSYAEIHRAMTDRGNASVGDRMQTHVFVATFLSGRNGRSVLGVMYNFGANDLNRRTREGVAVFGQHPMLSDPRVPLDERRREFVYTLVHETGHALNLLHSFDKGRPAALSWMNYPHLYPLGAEAGPNHDGTEEFWSAFDQTFDDLELRHLRHATPREIGSGGFAFGVYEEGATPIEGGTVDPRLTQLGSNPLRQTRHVALSVSSAKRHYHFGEPIFVELKVDATGTEPVRIPDALDPSEGFVRFIIEHPDGHRERYAPPLRTCLQAPTSKLTAETGSRASHPIPLFLGARGPMFTAPGRYRVWAELAGIDNSRVAFAEPYDVTVIAPDMATQMFAEELWQTPGAMEALYLRHPLADHDAWQQVMESAARHRMSTKRGNTTDAYLNFVAATGWSRPFQYVDRGDAPADWKKMKSHLREIDPAGLPESIQQRLESMDAEARPLAPAQVVVGRTQDRLRDSVPPGGLFGELGLDRPNASPPGPLSPFIVVRTLVDNPAFADVVSWNIQHLHGTKSKGRIEKIAEYMDTFRCDFWGLQETDGRAIGELVEASTRAASCATRSWQSPAAGSRARVSFAPTPRAFASSTRLRGCSTEPSQSSRRARR